MVDHNKPTRKMPAQTKLFLILICAKTVNVVGHLTAAAGAATLMLFFLPNAVSIEARVLDSLIAVLGGLFGCHSAEYCFIVSRLLDT